MNNKFLYIINFNEEESKMCEMEMYYLFNEKIDKRYFFSDVDIEVTRSLFTKSRLQILETCDSYDELIALLKAKEYYFDDYKVMYFMNNEETFSFKKGLELSKEVGYEILGSFNMKNPSIVLGFTQLGGKWYFGIYTKNTQDWHKHDDKPQNFSNSLPVRVARTLVNIAVGNNKNLKLADPCCGVGTVLLEALNMGLAIDGYDISYPTIKNARENIAYYQYQCVTKCLDIKDIDKYYDVVIIDLPYGLFTVITKEQQLDILSNAYRISDKLVLVTNVDMSDDLKKVGFKAINSAYVIKAQFKRYIFVATK